MRHRRALRQEGITELARQGFPTSRHEDWKYTNIAPVMEQAFGPVHTVHEASMEAAVARSALAGGVPAMAVLEEVQREVERRLLRFYDEASW